MTQLLTLDNIREHDQLRGYRDANHARSAVLNEIYRLIEANSLFNDRLNFPDLEASRLKTIMNQCLNWQHFHCQNPADIPDLRSSFMDHKCNKPDSSQQPATNNQLIGSTTRSKGLFQLGSNGVCFSICTLINSTPSASSTTYANFMIRTSSTFQLRMRNLSIIHHATNQGSQGIFTDGPGCCNDMSRSMPSGFSAKVTWIHYCKFCHLSFNKSLAEHGFSTLQHSLLLVGTDIREIALWEVSSKQKVASRAFGLWDMRGTSMKLKVTLTKEPRVSYSKHMVWLYSFVGGNGIRQPLEEWDVAFGVKQFTFEGYEVPYIQCTLNASILLLSLAPNFSFLKIDPLMVLCLNLSFQHHN
uniref:Uncharacterized protein n=1 Tax=Vitis vinifera TaxID=29760 RepID=F6H3W8_VITVI